MGVADFDNDGLLDLFVPSYSDSNSRDLDSYIYWNRPGRGFAAADRPRLFTHSASGCIAADFNGDGWIDLDLDLAGLEGENIELEVLNKANGWSYEYAYWWLVSVE